MLKTRNAEKPAGEPVRTSRVLTLDQNHVGVSRQFVMSQSARSPGKTRAAATNGVCAQPEAVFFS